MPAAIGDAAVGGGAAGTGVFTLAPGAGATAAGPSTVAVRGATTAAAGGCAGAGALFAADSGEPNTADGGGASGAFGAGLGFGASLALLSAPVITPVAGPPAAGTSLVVPSRATMKLVLHFGQRIFMPFSGMRRSSTSYGDLHDTHSTLIMFLRAGFEGDKTLRASANAQQDHATNTRITCSPMLDVVRSARIDLWV
jgi:hypothetical protein